MILEVTTVNDMMKFGEKIGAAIKGGTTVLLIGDVGAGKTTLTKGIASGMDVSDDVQSPTFTISRVYEASDNKVLAHYDFYRLHDAGIMADELHEAVNDPTVVTLIEWGEVVAGVVPHDHLEIRIQAISETVRRMELAAFGINSATLLEKLV
jgi:tRNA threonylcarbamoyladenosine biosynthesis protein TsaE